LVDEPVQPVGQDVAGDTQALLEFVEAVKTEQDVANDQQRPTLADNLERSRDRTVLAFVVTLQHASMVTHISCVTQPNCLSSSPDSFVKQLTQRPGGPQCRPQEPSKQDPRPPGRPRLAVCQPMARARAWLCWFSQARS